ncbi:hypothetical protein RIF23_01155 [Lipingzhangella sp. LS1_29]|uniref:Uncharacterized protein n=1 Tax=Lipingzhangella rawalii TaxID=2055835 RepID=A0ABU2H0R7_9ACTN|nr:hypothetical protein [Lipingzhangella rawalii]MDS1268896.1 hypothetical protein [Lipingzhangella rawalii]
MRILGSGDHYQTELLQGGTVVEHGVTVLDSEGEQRFAPLADWAQRAANVDGRPTVWRASQGGRVVAEGLRHPEPFD